jgi:hypothetical protein
MLQHPNIVPFLGIPAEILPSEIVYDRMEYSGITEYVRYHPTADRTGLVSEFVPLSTYFFNAKSHSCGARRRVFTTSTCTT